LCFAIKLISQESSACHRLIYIALENEALFNEGAKEIAFVVMAGELKNESLKTHL
jgi:hypothetical protein